MDLSRQLLKDFADVTKGVERDQTQYLRGTIKGSGEAKYVRIDGSESLTPISEIVDVQEGDRVLVTIENHEATILGNLTKPPSAYKEQEAIDKAEDAQNSANAAGEAAEDAKSLAQSAGNKADAAVVDATNASASANQAKQDAAAAMTAAENASKNSSEAKDLATAAGQNAATAREEAAAAQNAATAAQGEVTRIEGVVTGVKGDIDTALKEVADQAADLQATKETLEVTYAKKTDVSDVQAALTTEISKKVGELQTTVSQTYAAKNDVVEMEGRLQTQITQTAGEVTSVVGKVEQLESDTTEAQKKVDEALEKSAAAQTAASQAQANATASQAAADAAKANADTAIKKATEAAQNAATAAATAAEADKKVAAAQTDLNEAKQNLANTINRVDATEADIAEAQKKVETAQAAVTQAQKDAAEATLAANNAQTAANQAQNDATEAQNAATNAQKKADNAALAAGNAQAAADKAQQDVAALTKRVTSAETAITQNAEQIKLSATKTEEIGTKLENLQIGGTNLIRNTSNQLQHLERSDWHIFISMGNQRNFNLADYLGQRLTLRIWIQNPSVDAKLQLYFNHPNWRAGNVVKAGQSGYSQLTVDVPTALPTTWNIALGGGNGVAFALDYKELKAEIGDFATSWSPHPDDTQSQIDSTNSNLQNNYYSKTQTDAAINVAADSVTTTVRTETTEQITNINVGGTNLIRHSAIDVISNNEYDRWWYFSNDGTRYSGSFEQADQYISIKTDISKSGIWSQWQMDNNVLKYTDLLKLNIGDELTLGVDVWIDDNTSGGLLGLEYRVNPKTNYDNFFSISYCPKVDILKNKQWQRIYITGKITQKYMDCINDLQLARILLIRNKATKNNEIRFRRVKVEMGNKPTPWSPSPGDLGTKDEVQQAQDYANEANGKADATENRVTVAESTIKQLSDSIAMLVTDSNGSSMMTQTSVGWTFNISSITDSLNNAVNNIDSLTGSVNQANSTLNNLKQLTDDLSAKTAYINMTTDDTGAPCIELGKVGNDFKVRITNTSVDFIEGSSKIAYVSNQALFIEKAIIKNELQIGETKGFIWKTRSNGNLGLRWFS